MLSPVVALLLENFARISTGLRYCDGGRFRPLTRTIASRMFEGARSVRTRRTPAGSCPAHGAGRKAALLLKMRSPLTPLKERAARLSIDVAFDKSVALSSAAA